jgi:hypothetical protein
MFQWDCISRNVPQQTKKTLLLILAGILVLSLATNAADTKQSSTPARDALGEGLANGKTDSRNIFLLYGFPACSPCRLFERYVATPEVKEVCKNYFVLVKIDTANMADGKALQEEYGPSGAPSWAILNPAGEVLVDSDDGTGNVGYARAN